MSPVDPTGIDRRRRNIRTSNTNCSACAFTAPYANDRIALRVFVRKRGAGYRIQCDIPLGEDALPLRGCASSPPQTWDFAVICAHIGAHAMLHSDIACAPAPGARLRAFRPVNQGKCRTRQFPLDNSRILRIQSVYTVIATPPEPVASAARLPVSATELPVAHISESIRIRLFLLDGIIQFRIHRPHKAVFHSQASLPAISQ